MAFKNEYPLYSSPASLPGNCSQAFAVQSHRKGIVVSLPKRCLVLVITLSLLLCSLPPGVRAQTTATQQSAQPQVPANKVEAPPEDPSEEIGNEKFVFGEVDQQLLSEIKLLDERFEKEGAVYHESGLDSYLTRVGNALVADKKFENVEWKFRALRDPIPNAFALPN